MIGKIKDVAGQPIISPLAQDAVMKVLVGPNEGWDSHVLRVFELKPNGHTPKHTHAWPHINFVIEGTGILFLHGVENKVEAGTYAFIPSGELHQFKNTGDQTFKFICIVPRAGHQ